MKYRDQDGAVYEVKLSHDSLLIWKDGIKKAIKVDNKPGFRYKVLKTKINADGGALALYDWLKNAIESGFMDVLARKVVREAYKIK